MHTAANVHPPPSLPESRAASLFGTSTAADPALSAAPSAADKTLPAPTRWRRLLGRSLFWKIYAWFLLAALVIALTVAVTVYFTDPDLLYTRRRYIPIQLRDQQASRGAEIYEHAGKKALRRYLDELEREASLQRDVARPLGRAYLFDRDGKELSGARPPDSAQALAARAWGNTDEHLEVRMNRMLTARATASPSGKAYVFVSTAPRKSIFVPDDVSGWVRVLAMLTAAAAVCWWLARYVSAPVRLLRAATRQLAAGDLSARVDSTLENRADEFSDLAHDFNDMAARIEDLLSSQRRLIADVSHELGSPLTRVNVALGLAFRKAGPEAQVDLQRIGRETKKLSGLIHQLLLLSQLESRAGLEPAEEVSLRELIDEVAADASFEAESKGRRVRVIHPDGEDAGRVRGARHLLRSAVENVVRNAVRHTAPGTEVRIELEPQPLAASGSGNGHANANGGSNGGNGGGNADHVAGNGNGASISASAPANGAIMPTRQKTTIVRICDQGPGVPPEALGKLFQPFYRVSEAREHQQLGGAGLGLAIAEQAVKSHGGALRARNLSEGGLCVEIELKTVG